MKIYQASSEKFWQFQTNNILYKIKKKMRNTSEKLITDYALSKKIKIV